jgi:hypothetical protein
MDRDGAYAAPFLDSTPADEIAERLRALVGEKVNARSAGDAWLRACFSIGEVRCRP